MIQGKTLSAADANAPLSSANGTAGGQVCCVSPSSVQSAASIVHCALFDPPAVLTGACV
jgi:hypothetical protein